MAAKTCPSCSLVLPATAVRCECGFDFERERLISAARPRREVTPWHQEPVAAIALLVFCWPLGMLLLWQNRQLKDSTKALVTCAWLGLAAGAAIYRLSR